MKRKSTKLTKEELDYEMKCLARGYNHLGEQIDAVNFEIYKLLKRMKKLLDENNDKDWQREWDMAYKNEFEELDSVIVDDWDDDEVEEEEEY